MPELPGTGLIYRSSGRVSWLNLAWAASVRVTPGEAAIMSAKARGGDEQCRRQYA